VINRDGKIVKRFKPSEKPESPEVTKAVEDAIAAK
jgi:glutathione peroxidase-family protein